MSFEENFKRGVQGGIIETAYEPGKVRVRVNCGHIPLDLNEARLFAEAILDAARLATEKEEEI